MNAPVVFHDEADTREYRSSVATIIEDIERATGDTLTDIAENTGVTRETISNAKNCKASLNVIYLERLGKVYGAAFLNPWMARMGAQATPLERRPQKDVLPILTGVTHEIAKARDPQGPGGATEVPQERKAYLPKLKELQHEVGCLISEVEAV